MISPLGYRNQGDCPVLVRAAFNRGGSQIDRALRSQALSASLIMYDECDRSVRWRSRTDRHGKNE